MNQLLGRNVLEEIEIKTMRQLIAVIRDTYAVDLGDYALSSLKRRVLVEANKQGVKSVLSLIDRIENDSDYFDQFISAITVDTTELFRDPAFWRLMREELPKRFSKYESIKIWVAGCSSGQEVYSLSILLHELGLLEKSTILATDLNQVILDKAASGHFDPKTLEALSRNYLRADGTAQLEDYFEVNDKTAVLKDALRSNIQFAQHNLASLKSTGKQFDIILCRNQLIYFNHTLHEKVLLLLHETLAKDGLLAIGSMERLLGHAVNGKLIQLKDDVNLFRKY